MTSKIDVVLATRGRRRLAMLAIALVPFTLGTTLGALVERATEEPPLLTATEARLRAPTDCDRVFAKFTATPAWEYRCTTFTASYVSRPLTDPHDCREEGGRPEGTWQERVFSIPSLCRHVRIVGGRAVRFTGDRAVGYLPDTPPPAAARDAMNRWSTGVYQHQSRSLPGHPAPPRRRASDEHPARSRREDRRPRR